VRYKIFGSYFNKLFRSDLNENMQKISDDIDGLLLPVGTSRLQDQAVTEAKTAAGLVNRMKHGIYQLTGGLTRVKYNADNSVVVSFDTVTLFTGNPGGGSTGVFNITGIENITIPNLSALYVDLSETAPFVAKVTPGTYYSAATYGAMGFVDDSKVILLANYNGRLHGLLNPKRKTIYDNKTLVLKNDGTGNLDIYIKGSKPESMRYVHYPIKHLVAPLDTAVAGSNYDVWRIQGIYEVERQGQYTFNQTKQICNPGEIELAVRGTGWGDNVGGSNHGDEIIKSATMFIDGVKTSLDSAKSTECKSVKLIVKSDLYKDTQFTNGTLTKFAEHMKIYDFTSDGIKLYQEVKFLESLQLMNCYMGMMPVRRLEDGATGAQITNEAMRDYDYVVYGVSTEGFNNDLLTKRKGVKNAWAWGTGSGISTGIEILNREAWLTGEGNIFKNEPQYNKYYFDYCGSYTTAINEVFKQTLFIKVDTSN
jgi:hypothetical protein